MINPFTKKSGNFYTQDYAEQPTWDPTIMVKMMNGPKNRKIPEEFQHVNAFYIPVRDIHDWNENDVKINIFENI